MIWRWLSLNQSDPCSSHTYTSRCCWLCSTVQFNWSSWLYVDTYTLVRRGLKKIRSPSQFLLSKLECYLFSRSLEFLGLNWIKNADIVGANSRSLWKWALEIVQESTQKMLSANTRLLLLPLLFLVSLQVERLIISILRQLHLLTSITVFSADGTLNSRLLAQSNRCFMDPIEAHFFLRVKKAPAAILHSKNCVSSCWMEVHTYICIWLFVRHWKVDACWNPVPSSFCLVIARVQCNVVVVQHQQDNRLLLSLMYRRWYVPNTNTCVRRSKYMHK